MQFTISALISLAALATALPPVGPSAGGFGNANGVDNKGNTQIRFPVPDDLTIKQAQAKCGDQAQLSCCNHATYAGDTTDVSKGLLAGTLGHLIGSGSGSEGLGLFDQCSQLDVQGKLPYTIDQYILTILQSPSFSVSLVSKISSRRTASRTLPVARTPPPVQWVLPRRVIGFHTF